jgi:hypothetical protein
MPCKAWGRTWAWSEAPELPGRELPAKDLYGVMQSVKCHLPVNNVVLASAMSYSEAVDFNTAERFDLF